MTNVYLEFAVVLVMILVIYLHSKYSKPVERRTRSNISPKLTSNSIIQNTPSVNANAPIPAIKPIINSKKEAPKGLNSETHVVLLRKRFRAARDLFQAIEIDYPDGWRKWPKKLHDEPEQKKRAAKAIYDDIRVDRCVDSDQTGYYMVNVFQTSFSDCTCADFNKRKLPCKHMYALCNWLHCYIKYYLKYFSFRDPSQWGGWNRYTHSFSSQRSRLEKAIDWMSSEKGITVYSIDNSNSTGVINDYNVSLTNCTCEDFRKRSIPCKHIYRLALELDVLK